MNMKKTSAMAIIAVFLVAGVSWLPSFRGLVTDTDAWGMGHGDVSTLRLAFENWRHAYEGRGGSPTILKLGLGYSKALSARYTKARGRLELNLVNGSLSFRGIGLEPGNYVLWLVDNRPGADNTARPEVSDRMIRIGRFEAKQGSGFLTAQLSVEDLAGFSLDTVVLTEEGQAPEESLVIVGAVDLLQKLYYADKPWTEADVGRLNRFTEHRSAPFELLLPKVAQADAVADLSPILGPLVAQGRELFHKETFAGNGRTCGTCHREDNNFTIDPNYIMKLPGSDPLFVAETNPDLKDLENPTLMRKFALILTNVDGPGIDIFRSVPHTLSLSTTIGTETMAAGGEFPEDGQFANATGWSGDGAPGSGSLRDFTLGAIAQHLPKTLNRQAGVDFRVPTPAELDAMQAYMLSLGRSKDYPVYQFTFTDPLTQSGKVFFDTKQNPCTNGQKQTGKPAQCPSGETIVLGQTANCNGCHQNAGGRSSTTNANPTRNTGVERMSIHPARLVKPDLAYDGGFGQAASYCGPNVDQPCYGDGRFNTPPLIEAADTAPYFHNNIVSTLEESIAAYNSDAFNTSPGVLTSSLADRRGKLDSSQVVAVAAFLRAINALENLRLSDYLDRQAMQISFKGRATAKELIRLGYKENQDAIRVLKEGVLGSYWKVVLKLEEVALYQARAKSAASPGLRNHWLKRAIALKQEARTMIASCSSWAPVPGGGVVTVPPAGSIYTCGELGFQEAARGQ